jgi:hypothetical protein
MTKPLVEKCVDCGNVLKKNYKKNKHHFRCNKCWFNYKEKISLAPIKLPLKLKTTGIKL